jgi:hypothetical protein
MLQNNREQYASPFVLFQNAQLTAEAKWDQNLFESAKSSLIFEIIEREKSVGDVVTQSLLSYFKRVDHDYNR